MLKHFRGRDTDAQLLRCATMGGAFGKDIDRLFTEVGLTDTASHGSKKRTRFSYKPKG